MRFLLSLLCSVLALSVSADEQVPFGDVVSKKIYNYHRHTPTIATAGKLKAGAIAELQQHGFNTIIDLRTAAEGVAAEAAAVKKSGMVYHNLAVNKSFPTAAMLDEFQRLIEDKSQHPILLHCGSANRVGMVWAAYLIRTGHSYDTAVLAGRTIGMKPAREKQLEQNLTLLKPLVHKIKTLKSEPNSAQ